MLINGQKVDKIELNRVIFSRDLTPTKTGVQVFVEYYFFKKISRK